MKVHIIHKIQLFICLLTLLVSLTACQQEADTRPADGKATIRLSLNDMQLYSELTRAEQSISDLTNYSFTLNGTTIGGVNVTDLVLDVDAYGVAEVNAGTYTLSANNQREANTDNGHPYYSSTSEPFTVDAGDYKPVSIALGKPKNARISYVIDDTFSALYESPNVTLFDGKRSVSLISTEDECYFIIPASGALAYTITAEAKAGSHATDMPLATGYVEIQAGYSTTITLKANPTTGIIIPVVNDEYSGTFD